MTRPDETVENNNQLKHRSYQKTQHKNGRQQKENPEVEKRIQKICSITTRK